MMLYECCRVTDYRGCDPTGVNDSTEAIDAAFASSQRSIFFPPGDYKVSSTLVPPEGATLLGIAGQSTITTTQASGDVLLTSNPFVTIDGLNFNASVTRAGGAFVHMSAGGITLRNFTMANSYTAIQVDGVSITTIDRGSIEIPVSAGQGLVVYGTPASGPLAAYFGHTIINTGGAAVTGIELVNTGDLVMENIQSLGATNGLLVAPVANGAILSLKASNCFFDHCGTGLAATLPGPTGAFARSTFVDCWFGSSSANNILLQASGGALIDDIRFIGCDMVLCAGGSGLVLSGNVAHTKVQGCLIAANDVGIFDARTSGANGLIVIGNTIGQGGGGLAGNTGAAISFGGAGDYSVIQGNVMIGNGAAIQSSNSGTNNVISANPTAAAAVVA